MYLFIYLFISLYIFIFVISATFLSFSLLFSPPRVLPFLFNFIHIGKELPLNALYPYQAAHYHMLCLNIVTFTFDLQSGGLQGKEIKERNMFMLGKVGFYDQGNELSYSLEDTEYLDRALSASQEGRS
jgi:hypothetical protein